MIILGLVLLALGALVIVAAVFTADLDVASEQVEMLGISVGPVALFLLGVGAGVAIWWGSWLAKLGLRRSLARRKEQRRFAALSEKLERAEAQRESEAQRKGEAREGEAREGERE